MTHPSRFIFNSDYATPKNDNVATVHITLPNVIYLNYGETVTLIDREITLGQPAASMRVMARTSHDGHSAIPVTGYFEIPCRSKSSLEPEPYDNLVLCNVYRSAPGKIRIRATVYWDWEGSSAQFDFFGQTIDISIATFISPFSA